MACINHEFEDDTSTKCIHCGEPFTHIPRKPGYGARNDIQLANWVVGISRHNTIDGECCPDFSCCTAQRTPRDQRESFVASSGRVREKMLYTFLGRAMALYVPNGKVHIAGRDSQGGE